MTTYQNLRAGSILARLPNIFTARGYLQGRARAAETAEERSRKNVYHARAKLLQTACNRFTALCYETVEESSTVRANVDSTGKIRVGVPWNWRNCHSYGINREDADYLRWEMLGRCLPELDHNSIYIFYRGRWYIDFEAYPTEADAFQYWNDFPVTASTLAGFEQMQRHKSLRHNKHGMSGS